MAGAPRTERERLKWAIDVIGEWGSFDQWTEVENVFLHLDELDRAENAGLWKGLRRAMACNDALHEPQVQHFLRNDRLADEGHWWYDPGQWEAVRA